MIVHQPCSGSTKPEGMTTDLPINSSERASAAKAMTVSVIVPTFNRAHCIGECLESLLVQTVPPLEIVVIDDGSEDGTADVLARYGDRIRYVRKENGGKPRAVNLGLSLAQGALIWIFDDDDVALPDAIERRLEVLEAKPGIGFVYGQHFIGTNGPDGHIVQGRLYSPPCPRDEEFFFEIMRSCFFHLGTALVRRELLEALGGLDPALLSGEDYDLQIRLARIAKPAFCESPIFVFRQHGGVRGAKAIRYTASQRSSVFRKHSGAIGRKIRSSLALGGYLTPPVTRAIDQRSTRAALLNRIRVMANHGCIDEMFEDLRAVLDLCAPDAPLTGPECEAIALAMREGWAYEASVQDWPRFLTEARRLRGSYGGHRAVRALAKGVIVLARSYPAPTGQRLERAVKGAQIYICACVG